MNKENLKQHWAHHRNLLSRGHTEISLFYSIIQMSLILWLALRDMINIHREYVFIVVPIIILVAAGVQYTAGYFMNRTRMIDYYNKWEMDRNPNIRQILKEIKEIKHGR